MSNLSQNPESRNIIESPALNAVLQKLERYGVKRAGSGWRSQCPIHPGSPNSLAIDFSEGRYLFCCHSRKCSQADIEKKLGLDYTPQVRTENGPAHIIAYETLDRSGRLVATHKRIKKSDGEKQCWWEPKGLKTNQLPLYGSQRIDAFDPALPIDICEGQPATEALLGVMAQAIGTYGTGNEPAKEALSWAKGKTLRLWPDNDPPNEQGLIKGVEHMRKLKTSLIDAGAAKVIVLDTRSLPAKGDAVEWLQEQLAQGATKQDLIEKLKGVDVPSLPALEVFSVPTQPRARTYDEFMALELPTVERLCGEWFLAEALVMVSGDSGAGKTWFCLDLALSVSTGVDFMGRWSVPKARKVLLVSGEDRVQDLKKRIPALLQAKNKEAGRQLKPQMSFLVARDRALLPKGLPNLGTPEGRALVEAQLEGVELLILDNYSVLFNGVDENDAKEFAPIQNWLFELSARGVAVLLVAHTGKNGDHRGSSKKVDGLSVSILLNHPTNWKASDGASFELKFKKSRDASGPEVDPFSAKLGEDEDGALCWLFDTASPTTPARATTTTKTAEILELHAQGKTAKEMIEAGYSKTKVYFVLSSLKKPAPKVEGGFSRIPVPSHPKGCVTGHGNGESPQDPALVPSGNSRRERDTGIEAPKGIPEETPKGATGKLPTQDPPKELSSRTTPKSFPESFPEESGLTGNIVEQYDDGELSLVIQTQPGPN